jgi:DNA-directed RNA polymerase I, II, and III subunit RPABC2
MSDYSDSESSDNESVEIKKKPIVSKNNIDTYDEDEDEASEIENEEEENENAEDEELDIKIGGDDSDADEIKEYDDSDIDEGINEESDEDDEENEPKEVPKNKQDKAKPKKVVQLQLDSDDEDDDELDESYMQKFESEVSKNYIHEYHPECFVHNYEEIASLSKVVKNADNIIIDPLHKTIPFLTKYEKARVLGQRAKQIESGSKPFVRVPENVVDSYIIAELELQQKRIPFIIRRPLPNGGCEYWNLKDLEIIGF